MRGDSGASVSRRLRRLVCAPRPFALLLLALFVLCLVPATARASDDELSANFNYDTDTGLTDGIAVADFDGDGEFEVARAMRELDNAGVVRVEVNYSSQQEQVFLVHTNEPVGISAADVDNDGDTDLVFGSALTGATTGIWLNDGAGDLAPAGIEVAPVRFRSCHSITREVSRLKDRGVDACSPESSNPVGWQPLDVQPVPMAVPRATSRSRSTLALWSSLAFRGPPAFPAHS